MVFDSRCRCRPIFFVMLLCAVAGVYLFMQLAPFLKGLGSPRIFVNFVRVSILDRFASAVDDCPDQDHAALIVCIVLSFGWLFVRFRSTARVYNRASVD